jgi:hypothetical protein
MTDPQIQALRKWYRQEFDRRTKLLEAGNGRIDWLDKGTRVSWSEVWIKAQDLGINLGPAELRLQLQSLRRRYGSSSI